MILFTLALEKMDNSSVSTTQRTDRVRTALVCELVTGSALRLLGAAVLALLMALPAAAHPGHGPDAPVTNVGTVLDISVNQARTVDQLQDKQEVRASALASSSCCYGLSANYATAGCASGVTCGSGSCGHSSGVALSYGPDTARTAKAMVAYVSDHLLAGLAPGPDDRPPRP